MLFDMSGGLLATKSAELLADTVWNIAFYQHILLGAVAMLTGWIQFNRNWRNKNLKLHRNLGKVYLVAVLLSGLAGFYLALHATAGLIASLGFIGLAIGWLYTTVRAYRSIRKGNTDAHEQWMVRSYAFTFAAVTLRFWLPGLQLGLGLDFFTTYKIVAWLCWVPNALLAEWLIARKRRQIPVGI